MTRFAIIITTLGITAIAATPANARKREITPYIEIGQVVAADLNTKDVLTYSTVAVGVDASISTRRVEAQINYRYERRIGYQDRIDDRNVHSGLARAAVRVVPGVSIEGGAIATRAGWVQASCTVWAWMNLSHRILPPMSIKRWDGQAV